MIQGEDFHCEGVRICLMMLMPIFDKKGPAVEKPSNYQREMKK